MKFKLDSVTTGFLLGMIAPFVLLFIYWQTTYSYMDLDKFYFFLNLGKLHVKLLSLFTVLNLGLFFYFIWRYQNYAARGVLFSTFLYALVVIVVKFVI